MKDRTDRILDSAIELAEKGGFENVRQRELAARADVALGTLYRRFQSKEEVLVAAIERDSAGFEKWLSVRPIRGSTRVARSEAFFKRITVNLCARPQYARAVVRAMASGEVVASKVAEYQARMTGLLVQVLRDGTPDKPVQDRTLARILLSFWYATMVGFCAGFYNQQDVVREMRTAVRMLHVGKGRGR